MYMVRAFPRDQCPMMICLITASFHCIHIKIIMTHLMVWRVLNAYTLYIIISSVLNVYTIYLIISILFMNKEASTLFL